MKKIIITAAMLAVCVCLNINNYANAKPTTNSTMSYASEISYWSGTAYHDALPQHQASWISIEVFNSCNSFYAVIKGGRIAGKDVTEIGKKLAVKSYSGRKGNYCVEYNGRTFVWTMR